MSEKKIVVVIGAALKDKNLIEMCVENLGWNGLFYSSVTEALSSLVKKTIWKVFVDFSALTDYRYDIPRLESCLNVDAEIVLCFKNSKEVSFSPSPKIKVANDFLNIALFLKETVNGQLNALEENKTKTGVHQIIGDSIAIKEVRSFCEKHIASTSFLMLCGHVGTGKRLVAKLIYQLGNKTKDFVEINLADLKNLYGWESLNYLQAIEILKGSVLQKTNLFLYLKNFELLDKGNQIRFLEKLDSLYAKDFHHKRIRVIISSAHTPPDSSVQDFFRNTLNGDVLALPDLASRKQDVACLFDLFLKQYFDEDAVPQVSKEVYTLLQNYRWPNNVRELRQVAAHVSINYHGGVIKPNDLPESLQTGSLLLSSAYIFEDIPRPLEAFEAYYITEILKSVNGNISKAARQLGVTRNTIKSKLKKAGNLLAEEYAPLRMMYYKYLEAND